MCSTTCLFNARASFVHDKRNMTFMVYVLVVLATVCLSNAVFVNDWDQSFKRQCPSGTSLSSIYSEHDNKKEDRRWSLACARTGASESCAWTPSQSDSYANNYDGLLLFQCSGQGVITGIDSRHSNRREDRQFKFRCCAIPNVVLTECTYTGWQNDYDRPMDFKVPAGKVLRGAFSLHDNKKEDRRWVFTVCSTVPVRQS
ncbi:hemagglutinin/amebocyte aggregation factor-like [Haliotis rubra]|uniref:hemagglutinin/amebocyte aggregation factor-like n=1 Tax=Haliotis rubra TaxID=36100 RepID=UPI001EE60A18|nr:hemagglutinin/amebocyte aggregation factor-like [Haliotis rubra]